MTKNPPTSWPTDVLTLAIDSGGSGVKAAGVNTQGVMTTERVRGTSQSTEASVVTPNARYMAQAAGTCRYMMRCASP